MEKSNTPKEALDKLHLEVLKNQIIWNKEDRGEPDPRPYDKRVKEAKEKAYTSVADLVEQQSPEAEETAKRELQNLIDTVKEVYTDIGMYAGAKYAQVHFERALELEKNGPLPKEPIERLAYEVRKEQEAEAKEQETDEEEEQKESDKESTEESWLKEFMKRGNLQSIGSFILASGVRENMIPGGYEERLKAAETALVSQLKELVGESKADDVDEVITEYNVVSDEVYFLLGMKCGAKLAMQLFSDNAKDH